MVSCVSSSSKCSSWRSDLGHPWWRHPIKHSPRYWPFVKGIRWIPLTNGQWLGALIFSLMWGWEKGWANSRYAGDFRLYGAHCDVTVLIAIANILAFKRDCWDYADSYRAFIPFPNFNGFNVEVLGSMNNVILHFVMGVITYPSWD